MPTAISIHPAVDQGTQPADANVAGGTLACHCPAQPVTVAITGQCHAREAEAEVLRNIRRAKGVG